MVSFLHVRDWNTPQSCSWQPTAVMQINTSPQIRLVDLCLFCLSVLLKGLTWLVLPFLTVLLAAFCSWYSAGRPGFVYLWLIPSSVVVVFSKYGFAKRTLAAIWGLASCGPDVLFDAFKELAYSCEHQPTISPKRQSELDSRYMKFFVNRTMSSSLWFHKTKVWAYGRSKIFSRSN